MVMDPTNQKQDPNEALNECPGLMQQLCDLHISSSQSDVTFFFSGGGIELHLSSISTLRDYLPPEPCAVVFRKDTIASGIPMSILLCQEP